ncbi:MAG TPA: BON domain-containing protein [Acidobacteriaceae bacterium]|nr:BON domain-containing protein [Acidobacteriaceae bacterium]
MYSRLLRAPRIALSLSLLGGIALTLGGCHKNATVDDATLTQNVQSALKGDASIAQQPVQVGVQQGVVTLSGNVSDETASSVAAQDAAKVQGVKEVVNNLSVAGMQVTPTVTSPSAPSNPRQTTAAERQAIAANRPLPPPPNGRTASAPPQPTYHDVTVPAGKEIPVRITETLDSEHTQPGTRFGGVVTHEVVSDGLVVIPAGASVTGRVVEAKDAGHFKGHSLLSIELTDVRRHGSEIRVSTRPYTVEGKNRGKNSAEKIGGGAAVGAVLGGIFGGGKGAAIGSLAGAGGGAAYQGVTRGQQVEIPSESVIRFRLTQPFTVRTSEQPSQPEEREQEPTRNGEPTLHTH